MPRFIKPAALHAIVMLSLLILGGWTMIGECAEQFPGVDQLPEIANLPDPLVKMDGTRIESIDQWASYRNTIKEMIQHYEYGHLAPAPDNLMVKEATEFEVYNGLARRSQILLAMGPDHSVQMRINVLVPNKEGKMAVLAQNTNKLGCIPNEEALLKRGYILAEYLRTDLDPDENNVVGCAQKAYPQCDWGTLGVWAWGGMRLVDYLHTLERVDRFKIAMTGHSRGGKTALLCGALDERILLVAPNGSGCGGAGCYRVQGEKSETLEIITRPDRFQYWFHPNFREFSGKETRLPFDQHFLKALVAPRFLLSTDAFDDKWANPIGTQATWLGAQPVFDLMKSTEKNGIHFRPGGHDHTAEDWNALADYADLHFFGKKVEREFRKAPFPDAPTGLEKK